MRINFVFQNALNEVCEPCERQCSGLSSCPKFDDISKLEAECDGILEIINGLIASAKELEPEYDELSDGDLMPECDSDYWKGSWVMYH